MRRRISEAFYGVLTTHPDVIVVEDLSGMRGRTKSRKLSRKVSRWMRSSLKERSEFLSGAGGSRLETVNPAYTSQECPTCGYVHEDNRKGDRFRCLKCSYTAPADQVGAVNTRRRYTDPELRDRIKVFTPKETVKKILMEIFHRRESGRAPISTT